MVECQYKTDMLFLVVYARYEQQLSTDDAILRTEFQVSSYTPLVGSGIDTAQLVILDYIIVGICYVNHIYSWK